MRKTVLKIFFVAAAVTAVYACGGRKPAEKGAGTQLQASVDERVHAVKVQTVTPRDVMRSTTSPRRRPRASRRSTWKWETMYTRARS